jgi:hypothetical protein
MPPALRYYHAPSWSGPDDDEDRSDAYGNPRDPGYSRWANARLKWGEQHGVDAVDIIREQVEMRRAAYGWVDGHAPRVPPQLGNDD